MYTFSNFLCEASEETLQWLAGGKKRGTVHSVFGKAMNCELSDGFFSVLSPDALSEPMALKICRPILFTELGIRAGDPVEIDFPVFSFGAYTFSTFILRRWEESIALDSPVSDRLIAGTYMLLGNFLTKHGKQAGAGVMFSDSIDASAKYWIKCVSNLISSKTIQDHFSSMKALVGLGPGLTPSGDDFLSGYVRTMLLLGSTIPFYTIISQLKHRTNSLSARSIELAALGRCAEEENLLFKNLFMRYNPTEATMNLNRIACYGATSGIDLLYGIWIALGKIIYGDRLIEVLFGRFD